MTRSTLPNTLSPDTLSPSSEEMIRLEHVVKRFGGLTALNEVCFAIDRGEIHAVVGENGAGKSTLMKMLAGVYRPDSGPFVLRGEPVRLSPTRSMPADSASASSSRS